MDAMGVALFNDAKTARKTAIEPTFDLLSKLLATTGQHKPLPVSGLAFGVYLFRTRDPAFTTHYVDECSVETSHPKCDSHQNCFSIKMIYETPSFN